MAAKRLIGTVVPVGALRGRESSGVGEFLDLIDFADLCADMGIGLIQILPVNDTGYESSPYSALTAFGLNPVYLRLSALEEAAGFEPKIRELGKNFDGETRFPYYRILKAKMELLREIYGAHSGEIKKQAESGALGTWIAAHPWVKPYAVYRRLKEANGEKSWRDWADHQRAGDGEIKALWDDPALKGEHLFWAWLQRNLDSQFDRAAGAVRERGILLEGDLPILMNEDSCDVWAHPEIFRADLSAGAPPDMYSPEGQNWGFPIYNWEAQAGDGYAWWKARLSAAGKYYDAYRIDHVLGFFRIWASSRYDNSSVLGRFVPSVPLTLKDLEKLGFDEGRIRWLSRPHLPTGEVWDGVRQNWKSSIGESQDSINGNQGSYSEGEISAAVNRIFDTALDRIGTEELWLFKKNIRGEKDIAALDLGPAAQATLIRAWQNRLLLEYAPGEFFPVWYCRDSRAYRSLSEKEREGLEKLLQKRQKESEKIWEKEGEKLLSVLTSAGSEGQSSMLPCAEDLGAVPGCVPRVLAKLDILGLRVIRWFREWDKKGQPYVPFEEYPSQSVCTASVHDSSTLREWWDTEADQDLFAGFIGFPSLPRVYNPGTAKIILKHAAAAASCFRVFQIQDLLHLSQKWYAADPASERINVPGTANEFNWTYRLPADIETLRGDGELIQGVKELAAVKMLTKKEKG